MSKGTINISVSGGSNDFGNIVQGDNNTISYSCQKAVESFDHELRELLSQQSISQTQYDALKQDVDALVAANDKPTWAEGAKALYEKYEWALAPLQKLFSVLLI
ncbi:hypothetical protein GCM10011369_30310 [Neiella marina]|uniref:Uncharacterized protein n=1 Tax=Neiella marina TaxID=508461 RepID=A0A8J2U8G3_9GAMM|nr:hypothetical protein [Neiella marina]GGA86189.1 hypothetical protein GCM10011369_30310 [Neiella marina]